MQKINFGERNLPGGYQLKTVKKLNELLDKGALTKKDIDEIRHCRMRGYSFICDRITINSCCGDHYNEPKSIFFLDIKKTLYSGGTHYNGGLGYLLGRSPWDSDYISSEDIRALGRMIDRTRPQNFRLTYYSFNNGYKVVPEQSELKTSLVKRPFDPFARPGHPGNFPPYVTKHGPFCVVFVSSDDTEKQKNIISLLYYIYLFDEMRKVHYTLFDSRATEKDIIAIETLLKDKYDNDFMKFLEYENDNFAKLDSETVQRFKDTINGLFFRSTSETGKTKVQLMDEFLESDIRREKVGSAYNVFALGDNADQDLEMILNAFLNGGFGFIREDYDLNNSLHLMDALYEKGIDLPFIPYAFSFSSFYDTVINTLMEQRENELIEAMTWANGDCGEKQVFHKSGVVLHLKKEK